MPGRKPAPQLEALPLGRPRPSVSYIVTNAGRLRLSLPSPYVTHAPTHGKPMRDMPVLIWNSAGEWLFVSVQHEWTNAMSSTCLARLGKISGTHVPDWPCCFHANGDFISGPTWSMKKPVFLSQPFSSSPSCLTSSGL